MALDHYFLPEAFNDLERIYVFLAKVNKPAAKKALSAIYESVERLSEHPEIGRPLRGSAKFRQWVVKFGASGYVIRYRVTDTHIIIVRVWHGREDR